MSDCDNSFRISSITHNSVALAQPVGGSITETVSYIKNRPGIRKAPCVALDEYDLEADAEYQGLVTPTTRATKSSLVYVLLQLDGGSTTVTVTNMCMGGTSFSFSGGMHKQTNRYQYDSGTSDDLAPITVS